jgi:hypothetical protein
MTLFWGFSHLCAQQVADIQAFSTDDLVRDLPSESG